VIDTCNLKCRYCYAEYGRYGDKMGRLEKERYMDLIIELSKYYHTIDKVQFFGGEPLLSLDKISMTCLLFKEMFDKGMVSRIPEYSMVSNGLFLPKDEVQKLIKTHNIHITVSCDGPKEITNYLRPKHKDLNKKSNTYDEIKKGIKTSQNNGVPLSVEATYTKYHQEAKVTPLRVIDAILEDFGIGAVHQSPAAYSPWGDYRPEIRKASNEFYEASLESTKRIINDKKGILESTLNVIQKLSSRKPSKGILPSLHVSTFN
jgi:uncharacterized protein